MALPNAGLNDRGVLPTAPLHYTRAVQKSVVILSAAPGVPRPERNRRISNIMCSSSASSIDIDLKVALSVIRD